MTAPPTDDSSESYLVVVGSSAGGIEALSLFVAGLPDGFGAPIVIAQHLDPSRPSHLAEILGRRTRLPVVTIEDRADLEPGSIYVVPADRHVEVTDHAVSLVHRDGDPNPAPSVDRLMSSAAPIFGERLIAVVLTGTGSDGANGAHTVKQAGGTVVIQDPDEARFPSMPESLEPTVVDLVVQVEALGALLSDLVRGAYRPVGTDDGRALERFLATVRDRTGIDFSRYKRQTILRRLQRRMAAVRKQRLSDYAKFVATHPEEYQRLVATFLIKVTEFFRDTELFEQLRTVILPELIASARENGQELRIWCAGCATGEEPYSIAILIADLLGDELDEWTVRIFATDLDPDAVAFARRGKYRAPLIDGLPPDMVARHFKKTDGQYEVRKHLRAMTVFGEHDLALRAPFPRIDLGLCRNVLIYFTPELQRRALHLFAFSIRPGGYFVLGKAETATPLPEYFEVHESRLRLSRRRATPAPVPPAQAVRPHSRPSRQRVVAARERPHRRTDAASRAEALDDGLLASLAIGAALVGERYEIRQVNAAARRILGIHSAAVGEDLLHLVERLPAGELRGLLDSGLRGIGQRRVMELIGPSLPDETASWVEITVDPAREGSERGALISIRDAPPDHVVDAAPSEPHEGAHPSQRRLLAAEEVSRRLLRDNEELASQNAELRTANEEMQLGQEEAQAATEEVETLNEELQATNEELETLNEELQATVEELNTTGEDMQARTVELQLLATHLDEQRRVSETERLRFELLVEALTDAVALIDRAGTVVIRNEAYRALMEEDGFQPLDEESRPLAGGNLRRRVVEGETFTVQFAARDAEGQRRWYEAYGRPVPSEMGTGGGILVVHDTTDLSLRRLQEEFVAIVAHELRTPLTALRGYIQLLRRTVARGEAKRLAGGNGSDGADGADGASAAAPERSGRLLGLADEQAERLARLVEELFDVTRADTGRLVVSPEPMPLRSIIETTVEIAQSLSDQRIRVEGVDDSLVEVDGPRIQQVLLNLLTNAQRHASSSPTITVRARRLRRWLSIEVEDHGPGMSDELRESLFSRFHVDPTSPGRGLGLGLYISRQIVAAHGGTIEVDSAPGEGTTFTIRLPLVMNSRAADSGEASRVRRGSGSAMPRVK